MEELQPLSFFTKKKVFEHADKTFDTVFRKPLIISYPSKEPLTEKVSMSFPAKFQFFWPRQTRQKTGLQ